MAITPKAPDTMNPAAHITENKNVIHYGEEEAYVNIQQLKEKFKIAESKLNNTVEYLPEEFFTIFTNHLTKKPTKYLKFDYLPKFCEVFKEHGGMPSQTNLIEGYYYENKKQVFERYNIKERITGVLCDEEILELCKKSKMISPFVAHNINIENGNKVVSYGLQPQGYDVRLSEVDFKIMQPSEEVGDVLKPENVKWEKAIKKQDAETGHYYFVLQPNDFAIGWAVETIKIPASIVCNIKTKSSYARMGDNCSFDTASAGGFKGNLQIEICNMTPMPQRFYINQGIAHLQFLKSNTPKKVYNGQYQDQKNGK